MSQDIGIVDKICVSMVPRIPVLNVLKRKMYFIILLVFNSLLSRWKSASNWN